MKTSKTLNRYQTLCSFLCNFFVILKVPQLGDRRGISLRQASALTRSHTGKKQASSWLPANDDNNVVPNFSPNVI